MSQMLPIAQGETYYSMKVTLSARVFTIELRWNERAAKWMLNLLTANGTPLVLGLPVLTGQPLLAQYRYLGKALPPWELFALDDSGLDLDADLDTLGSSVLLYYGGS